MRSQANVARALPRDLAPPHVDRPCDAGAGIRTHAARALLPRSARATRSSHTPSADACQPRLRQADSDILLGDLSSEVARLRGDEELVVPATYFPLPLANGNLVLVRSVPKMLRAFERSPDWQAALRTLGYVVFDEWWGEWEVSNRLNESVVADSSLLTKSEVHMGAAVPFAPHWKRGRRRGDLAKAIANGQWAPSESANGSAPWTPPPRPLTRPGQTMADVYRDMVLHGELLARPTVKLLVQDTVFIPRARKHGLYPGFEWGANVSVSWKRGKLVVERNGSCLCPQDTFQFGLTACSRCLAFPGRVFSEVQSHHRAEVLGFHFQQWKRNWTIPSGRPIPAHSQHAMELWRKQQSKKTGSWADPGSSYSTPFDHHCSKLSGWVALELTRSGISCQELEAGWTSSSTSGASLGNTGLDRTRSRGGGGGVCLAGFCR